MKRMLAASLVPALFLAAPALAAGPQVYGARCAMCHKADGTGAPGQFPRLNGRAAQIAGSPAGRAYLVKAVLFGVTGPITVDGRKIGGMMPAMGMMKDQDVADVLNHLVSLGKGGKPVKPFTPAEVKAVRDGGKVPPAAVGKEHVDLAARGVIP